MLKRLKMWLITIRQNENIACSDIKEVTQDPFAPTLVAMVDLVFYLCHLIKVKGLMTAALLILENERGKKE